MRNKLLSVVSVLAVFAGTASARQQPDVQPSEPESTAKQPSKLPAMDSPALDAAHGGSAASCGGDCSTPDCGCEPPCGPPGRLWVDAEYLLWWTKSARVPPLVTSGTTSSAGILGREGTVVLVGNSGLDENPRSGLRIGGGFWLDDCHTLGLEGSYFFLGQRSSDSSFAGSGAPGTPVLARPFFNVI